MPDDLPVSEAKPRDDGAQPLQHYDAVIWLGDYKSLDDDVRIEDVGKRMEAVLRQLIDEGPLVPPFDLIVHSTGGLVARACSKHIAAAKVSASDPRPTAEFCTSRP